MEWGVHERLELASQERHDEILAWLDTFEDANRHRDHDGWMARSVASARAHFLWHAERYEEALVACDVVEQMGFEDAWYRYAAGSAKACVLEGLGRHAEALATFEEALRHHDLSHIETTRHLMHSLAEYSNRAGKPVDESWREVVQNVAHEYEVEMPVRDSLAETILALYELTENKPAKRQRAAQQC
jgi:tetratricopeptide (TPR) repeat protein